MIEADNSRAVVGFANLGDHSTAFSAPVTGVVFSPELPSNKPPGRSSGSVPHLGPALLLEFRLYLVD
jgi:hypothetical protein